LSKAKHALALNLKRFRQVDNEQYNSHTDICTVYVRILYQHLNVTYSFDYYHVDCQIHQASTPSEANSLPKLFHVLNLPG